MGAFSSPAGSLPQLRPLSSAPAARASSRQRAAVVIALDIVDVHDARRACADLLHLRLPGRGLALPWMLADAGLDPRAAEPGHARAWKVCGLGLHPGPEREHVETVVPSAQRVERPHAVDDAVAGTDRKRRAVEQADARAAEHEEDLLFRGLPVERRRPLPGIDLDPFQADGPRPGRPAEIRPLPGDVARFAAVGRHLVPVGDHMPIMSRASAVRGRPTTSSPLFGSGCSRVSTAASRSSPRSSASSWARNLRPEPRHSGRAPRSGRAGREHALRP